MSSVMRICPGVGGRKCGAFLASMARDPHPTCTRCRGRICTVDMTCDICVNWSTAQWEAFSSRRTYAQRKKRPAGAQLPTAPPPPLPCAGTSSEVLRPGPSSSTYSLPSGEQTRGGKSQGAVPASREAPPPVPQPLVEVRREGLPGAVVDLVSPLPCPAISPGVGDLVETRAGRSPFVRPAPSSGGSSRSSRRSRRAGRGESSEDRSRSRSSRSSRSRGREDRKDSGTRSRSGRSRDRSRGPRTPTVSRSRSSSRRRARRDSSRSCSVRERSRRDRFRSPDRYRSLRIRSRSQPRRDRSRSSDRYRSRRGRSRSRSRRDRF